MQKKERVILIENVDTNKSPDRVVSIYLKDNLSSYIVNKMREYYETIIKELDYVEITHNRRSIREIVFLNLNLKRVILKHDWIFSLLLEK